MFEGNTADPDPDRQITKLDPVRVRAGVPGGDRGMLTSARIRDERARAAGLDYRVRRIGPREPMRCNCRCLMSRTSSISSPDYPGERLVCCRNPALAQERTRKRDELLAATATELDKIAAATRRDRRRCAAGRSLRVGKVINKFKMAKHFTLQITDEVFTFARNHHDIAAEAALDGI